MKIIPKDARSSTFKSYADMMAELQAEARRSNKAPAASKEQAASTQAILQRDPSEDEKWFNRIIDVDKAQVMSSGKDVVTHAEQRKASYGIDVINQLEDMRHRSKNTMGDAISSGLYSTSIESKEKAVHHFLVSPPAVVTEADKPRITGLAEIKSEPPPPTPIRKLSWLERLLEGFKEKAGPEQTYSVMDKITWVDKE